MRSHGVVANYLILYPRLPTVRPKAVAWWPWRSAGARPADAASTSNRHRGRSAGRWAGRFMRPAETAPGPRPKGSESQVPALSGAGTYPRGGKRLNELLGRAPPSESPMVSRRRIRPSRANSRISSPLARRASPASPSGTGGSPSVDVPALPAAHLRSLVGRIRHPTPASAFRWPCESTPAGGGGRSRGLLRLLLPR